MTNSTTNDTATIRIHEDICSIIDASGGSVPMSILIKSLRGSIRGDAYPTASGRRWKLSLNAITPRSLSEMGFRVEFQGRTILVQRSA